MEYSNVHFRTDRGYLVYLAIAILWKLKTLPILPLQPNQLLEASMHPQKRIIIRKYSIKEEWYRLISNVQVIKCLQDGEIKNVYLDNEGNWRCLICRLCGGAWVHVDVVLNINEDYSLDRAYVLDIYNRTPI